LWRSVRKWRIAAEVGSIRKYVLSDGEVKTDERIQAIEFKVLWKADVKADEWALR
jgi:hypothetical protein